MREDTIMASVIKHTADLMQENHKLKADLAQAHEMIREFREALEEFENLEGSLCPEDFGFDEYIRHLRTKVDRLEAENTMLRTALERIANANGDPTSPQFEALSSYNMIGIAKQALGGEGF